MADRPSDAEALVALATLRAWLGVGVVPAVYTADALPPDCTSRDAFLRRHRERMKARVPGWTRRGMVRAVTQAAWDADAEQETNARRLRAPRLAIVPAQRDVSAELDRALGIRTRGAR